MQRSNGARIFPAIVTLIVVVLVIVAIVSIGRAIFSAGNESSSSTDTTDTGQEGLLDTSSGHAVRMRVRGPIVAQEEFKSYQIQISATKRSMTVYKGYLDDVQKQKKLSNTHAAYEEFVYALDKANMMKGQVPTDDEKNDLRGICATGYVYEYALIENGDETKRLWTSTCSGSKGSLDASTDQLNDLFYAQIPNSSDLIPFRSGLRLKF